MKFEQFEKEIVKNDYLILAMNHYKQNGKIHIYCVIHSQQTEKAFKAEGQSSEDVFDKLFKLIVPAKERGNQK